MAEARSRIQVEIMVVAEGISLKVPDGFIGKGRGHEILASEEFVRLLGIPMQVAGKSQARQPLRAIRNVDGQVYLPNARPSDK